MMDLAEIIIVLKMLFMVDIFMFLRFNMHGGTIKIRPGRHMPVMLFLFSLPFIHHERYFHFLYQSCFALCCTAYVVTMSLDFFSIFPSSQACLWLVIKQPTKKKLDLSLAIQKSCIYLARNDLASKCRKTPLDLNWLKLLNVVYCMFTVII